MKYDLEETTRRFHNIYEQVAKEYGYKTREDTKKLDFNSPNGMTMLKTVEMVTTPYLEEIERLNKEIETLKQPQVFIDTQDMEERYGEELYKEYLENENKRLHSIIKEVREYIEKGIIFNGCFTNNSTKWKVKDIDIMKILEIIDKEGDIK